MEDIGITVIMTPRRDREQTLARAEANAIELVIHHQKKEWPEVQ